MYNIEIHLVNTIDFVVIIISLTKEFSGYAVNFDKILQKFLSAFRFMF